MASTVQSYGTLPDGREARLFLLDGGEGVTVGITNFGGIITSIKTPDRSGKQGEIGLGLASLQHYIDKPNYYGALIGRVGNRIARGVFSLDGKEYRLWANPSGHHLHGGKEGFNRKLWNAETTADGVRLTYFSPDGEENYPGALSVTVEYSLRGRELGIAYGATADAATIVNLTNHEFFNLNGCADTILSHELRIAADRYTPVDGTLIPTGEIAAVKGTPFDFTAAKAVARDMAGVAGGYDHNFVFADGRKPGDWLVAVRDPASGRTLEMATDQPCVQFYAGNFLDGSDVSPAGVPFRKHYGFCLEAQKHPDAINHPNFANTVLRPGEKYSQKTVYRFGAE
jgi:aldose 1-epimerase